MTEVFAACLNELKLQHSWTESKIILIYKADKDTALPQSYWPISLLNIDYEILTSILAVRLNMVLSKHIHPDQSGFLPGRYLGSNIRRVMNVTEQAKIQREPLLLFFADTEKALDVYGTSIRKNGIWKTCFAVD